MSANFFTSVSSVFLYSARGPLEIIIVFFITDTLVTAGERYEVHDDELGEFL